MTTKTRTASPYLYRRGDDYFNAPFWTPEELQRHFQHMSTGQLTARLEFLYAKENTPANTGLPAGQSREWHCLHQEPKCPLCVAWINWDDECSLISRELKRRKLARR